MWVFVSFVNCRDGFSMIDFVPKRSRCVRSLAGVLFAAAAFCCFQAGHAEAAKRVAFVLGNGSYAQAKSLQKPASDAKALAGKFKELGFEVTQSVDRSKIEMEAALKAFVQTAQGAEVAVFAYTGYAIQIRGKNHLIPIDAKLRDVEDAAFELVELDQIVSPLQEKADVTLVFVDASRENPFNDNMRGMNRTVGGRGLARVKSRNVGTLLSFSTEPGAVTIPGEGTHSPYVSSLIEHLDTPGASISQIMTRVRRTVFDKTSGNQVPRDYNSLLDEFYLTPLAPVSVDAGGEQGTSKLEQELAALQAEVARLQQGGTADNNSGQPGSKNTTLTVGEVFRDCEHCPQLVVVPSGSFVIGSPNREDKRRKHEGPQKTVRFAKPFTVGQFEVTYGEYKKYVRETGLEPARRCWQQPGFVQTDDKPAICINWMEAKAYVDWLAKTTGKPYRLLSEAEWEYAARAGSRSMFSFGSKINSRLANFYTWFEVKFTGAKAVAEVVYAGTAPVDALKPNAFGLYHVHGNASEWVQDCYENSYKLLPESGKAYESQPCTLKVRRGGGWQDNPWKLRSAYRETFGKWDATKQSGFRVARDLKENETVVARLTGRALARALQQELKRVGCLSGAVDGLWGAGSRRALAKFNQSARANTQTGEPSQNALSVVTRSAGRVCLQ